MTFITQTSSYPYTYDPILGTVAWSIDYMAAGVTESFLLQAQVALNASDVLTNTVTGVMAANDPTPLNNQDTHATVVLPPILGPDLFVSKSGPAQAPAGFPLDYIITVANQGDQAATGVVITDALPADIGFVNSSHPTWNTTYYSDTNTVVWAIGTLAPGQSYNINLQAQLALTASLGVRTNQVAGTINESDADTDNNEASHQVQVLAPAPYLSITPATNGAAPFVLPVLAGGPPATLVVTVTNSGTGPLNGGLTISAIDYPWLTISPTAITGTLGAGQSVTFTISITDTDQALGDYYDLILFNSPDHHTVPLFLKTYVHPTLVSFSVPVSNTLGQNVPGALVSFINTVPRVISVDGGAGPPSISPYFAASATTDMQGVATMSLVEVGTYSYTVSAANHQTVTDSFVVDSSTTQFIPPPLLALPGLVFEPDSVATLSVVGGQSAYHTFQIRNHGPASAENFKITTPAEIEWLSSGLPYSFTQAISTAQLLVGEAMSVTLFLSPPDVEQDEYYEAVITVTADNVAPVPLLAKINVLADEMGTLDFVVTDAKNYPIAGAHVLVTNRNGRIVTGPSGQRHTVYDSRSEITGSDGRITFSDLPPAEYDYYVTAEGYYLGTGMVAVVPGTANLVEGVNQAMVQLVADPFTYRWQVIETQIQDTYAITVEITYEAEVVEPALYVSHAQFCPGDEVPFIVANMGPVAMTNVVLAPNHEGISFSPSSVNIGELLPGEAYTGTLTTSGSSDDASKLGSFNVSAQYTTQTGTASYTTSNKTVNDCGGGNWYWIWDDDLVKGIFTGIYSFFFDGSGSPPSPDNGREIARLILSGDATLTRQAFNARLVLDSVTNDTISNVMVNIQARDEDGNFVNAFAITPTLPTLLGSDGTLTPGGSLVGEWLIVPGDLGITDTNGAEYTLQAEISYTWNGFTFTTKTVPQAITVYPHPFVRLLFSHSQPDSLGEFYVEVTARNDGYGIARDLVLDLSQITTLGGLDGNGRSLLFALKEAAINGQAQSLEYVFNYGDLQPGETKTARWLIRVSASDGALLGNAAVTGFAVTCRHLPYKGLALSPLIECLGPDQIFFNTSCNLYCSAEKHLFVGGTTNTANGNLSYAQSGPSVPTAGSDLQLTWEYNSLNSGAYPNLSSYGGSLGTGWAHNYEMSLDFSQEDLITLRGPTGAPLYFYKARDTYVAAPGVLGTLDVTEVGSGHRLYTITAHNQVTYVFSDTGHILSQTDPQGNVIEYSYNGQGLLEQVSDPVSGRFLQFDYDDGRLEAVTDPLGREIHFDYNGQGLLGAVTDPRGKIWTYDYMMLAGGQRALSQVADPEGRMVSQTNYDSFARATEHTYRGQSFDLAYYADGRRLITNGTGQSALHVYNNQGFIIIVVDHTDQEHAIKLVHDSHGNVVYGTDQNNNVTSGVRTPFGYPTTFTNALGDTTFYQYDERNNLQTFTDALQRTTTYVYNESNNVVSTTNALGGIVSYTYNEYGRVKSATDENGHTTLYGYDPIGQLVIMTNAVGLTTTYGYDNVGRLITMTEATDQVTLYQYDAADHLLQVTSNYLPGQPQNYLNEYNLITRYQYDDAGYSTVVTNTLGQVDLTFYNNLGQVVTQVTNYDGATSFPVLCTDFSNPDPEYNLCTLTSYDDAGRVIASTDALGRVRRTFYDELGRVAGTVENWSGLITTASDLSDCLELPQERDNDVCTLYAYDPAGNTIIITDTLGRMTRNFYDPLNRVVAKISNWSGTITDTSGLSACLGLPVQRDSDVCTLYEYDEVGNQIIVTDTFGIMTRTFFDALNRAQASVQNWNPDTLTAPGQCVLAADNMAADNICTVYGYDPAGRQITFTDALSQTTLNVYDEANRPVIRVQNWDGVTAITADDTSGCADTEVNPSAESNLCTITTYDEFGRRTSTIDPMGRLNTFAYDSLGRVITTTRYLDGEPVNTVTTYDALGNVTSHTDAEGNTSFTFYDSLNRTLSTVSAGGVAITYTYDVAGRVVTTTNNLGYITISEYDGLGRVITATNAENQATIYVYDVLGNQLAVIDANGIQTSYEYDDLNRQVAVIQNDTGGAQTSDSNILTQTFYDALGRQVAVVNARGYTTTQTIYDSLGRVITVTDALGNSVTTQYNALGQRVAVTDANEAVTLYTYDGLSRLSSVSHLSDTETISYTYGAAGNRLTMNDPLGTTSYQYDDLFRLITVTNPLSSTVVYNYDKVGNRTGLTYPDDKSVTYIYDEDNRLVEVMDWESGLTTYQYDVAGRLITTTLANGVIAVNEYDRANRLVGLTYVAPGDQLLADYQYQLDGVGNKQVITETVVAPDQVAFIDAFLEENGVLTLEAEQGYTSPGASHQWISQTVQAGYAGTGYLRGLPDVGALFSSGPGSSPIASFPISMTTPATYTLWVRGMAAGAGGDSLHVGLDGAEVETASDLTGFISSDWSWSSLTMNNMTATLPITATGIFTLDLRLREDGVRVDRLLLITDTNYLPTGLGPAVSPSQTITITTTPPPIDQVVVNHYDGLYRLNQASYSGTLEATYGYAYDPVGNRVAYTTTITSTEVITYRYDIANRLVESVVVGGDATVYDWDNAGRLITTTLAGQVTHIYQYSQDGDLISAVVNGLTTTFAYDGDGRRLLMSVDGQVTTYTHDYRSGNRVLFEQGVGEIKHYLYGLQCLGEQVADTETSETEWRYYQYDGKNLVRQATNEEAKVTLAWTYSPEGSVLIGEEGPVTHLGCADDATYDWSTGLIYKRENYFDPTTGIWLSLTPFVVFQAWKDASQQQKHRKRGKGKRNKRLLVLLALLVLTLSLSGCNQPVPDTPTPIPLPCPTPTIPPITTTPTETPSIPTVPPPTNTPPVTSPPPPTEPPAPTDFPTPTINPDPLAGFVLANVFGGDGMYWTCLFGATFCGEPTGNHAGLDLVSKGYIEKSCRDSYPKCVQLGDSPTAADRNFRRVSSPVTGKVDLFEGGKGILEIIEVENNGRTIEGLEIHLHHIQPYGSSPSDGDKLTAGADLGMYFTHPLPHLHIEVHLNGVKLDPLEWFPEDSVTAYYIGNVGGMYANLPAE